MAVACELGGEGLLQGRLTMRAVAIQRYGGPEVVQVVEVPRPKPGPGEVLIRVRATSINQLDWRLRRGEVRFILPLRPPRVLGFDVAGQVEELGDGAAGFPIGTAVMAMLDAHRPGACADYLVMSPGHLVVKPPEMSFHEAAALPRAGITALQALRWAGPLSAGDRALVVGASGGIGTLVVQLAVMAGVRVTALCSSRNEELVRALGAERVVAYDREALATGDRFEAIVDVVDATSFAAMERHLVSGGRFVAVYPTVAGVAEMLRTRMARPFGGTKRAFTYLTEANAEDLAHLVELWRAGKLRPVIHRVFELEESGEAHRLSESRRARGKLVIDVCRGAEAR
ncbi:MAG: NAD(P)-dependent alcohol dehydrogenase [Deltaproteobacteria bacterium]|nr:NAD(P)-dependent alcohol dehydrogenase [Deltaproteobacteria bacterium]